MAKGKPPTRRKAAAGKGKAKPRKPSIKKSAAKPGKGHNKPPKEEVLHAPRPPISNWQTETTGQIAHLMAQRQRTRIAGTGIGTDTSKTPHALAHDPKTLHQVVLSASLHSRRQSQSCRCPSARRLRRSSANSPS